MASGNFPAGIAVYLLYAFVLFVCDVRWWYIYFVTLHEKDFEPIMIIMGREHFF